jgi:hypothetical protein
MMIYGQAGSHSGEWLDGVVETAYEEVNRARVAIVCAAIPLQI